MKYLRVLGSSLCVRSFAALVVLASVTAARPVSAFEGMWMPQQIPDRGTELQRLGLQLDPSSFADLTGFPMGAIVSLGGCSASFVSPNGLIATNHHCVHGALQYNSTPERDLIRDGFLARSLDEELPAAPDSRVYVTSAIEDVTAKVLAPMPRGTTDAQRYRLIERRRKEIIRDAERAGGVRVQVARFFEGTKYLEITSTEIRDVRLVYAPALGVGNFGADVDNWIWPRHTGDFGFYRAYVGRDGRPADYSRDNVPYQPKHWLKISTRDIDPGDLMIVTGYPGRTERYQTAAETEQAETFELPVSIRHRETLLQVLRAAGATDRAVAIRNASRIKGLDNYLKKYRGTLDAFAHNAVVAAKKRQEDALRSWFASRPGGAERYAAITKELDRIEQLRRSTRERDNALSWLYTASPMLTQADVIWRVAAERAKADDLERADGYQQRDYPRLRGGLTRAQRSFEPGSDRAGLRLFLHEAARLPANQRIAAVDLALAATGEKVPAAQIEKFLDALYSGTKIGQLDERKIMFDETIAQLAARRDSMIVFASALRRLGDENARRDEEIRGALSRIEPELVEGIRATRTGDAYPDANGTLRVSFGQVEGYSPRDALMYDPQTDAAGILEKDNGREPFDSPRTLLDLISRKAWGTYADPDLHAGILPVDFLSTNDITNGNSGSATLNAWGELAGLAFDGNIESMGSDYLYDRRTNRTIHVDARYMLWVMDAVDGAHNLLRELGITPQFEKTGAAGAAAMK